MNSQKLTSDITHRHESSERLQPDSIDTDMDSQKNLNLFMLPLMFELDLGSTLSPGVHVGLDPVWG
jgi:hypothetical protein